MYIRQISILNNRSCFDGLQLGNGNDASLLSFKRFHAGSNANVTLRDRIISQLHDELPALDPVLQKYITQCGSESAPAGQRLPAAGGDRAWAARTGSGPMRMCGDIFAAARLWRGRLLTTGRLSCRHPVVVCAGRGGKVAVAGQSEANYTQNCLMSIDEDLCRIMV